MKKGHGSRVIYSSGSYHLRLVGPLNPARLKKYSTLYEYSTTRRLNIIEAIYVSAFKHMQAYGNSSRSTSMVDTNFKNKRLLLAVLPHVGKADVAGSHDIVNAKSKVIFVTHDLFTG